MKRQRSHDFIGPRSDTISFNDKSNECAFEIVCRNYYMYRNRLFIGLFPSLGSTAVWVLAAKIESISARKMNVVRSHFRFASDEWKSSRHAIATEVPFSVELKLRLQFPLCATLALVLFCENENKVLKRWTWNRIRSTRAHNTQHLLAKTAFNKCSSDSRSGERFHRKWFDSKCLRVDSNSAKRNVFVLPFAVGCESDEQENEFIRGTNK